MLTQQSESFASFIEFNNVHPLKTHFKSSYYQLGFISSVQALPEILDLELWLPYLWEGDIAMSFADETQATEYAKNVLALVQALQLSYQQALPLSSLNCDQWVDTEYNVSAMGQEFCRGFIKAIETFNEHWLLLDEHPEVQNILQTVILLLSKMVPDENSEESLLAVFEQLPSTKEIADIMPKLISNLAYSCSQIVVAADQQP